LYAIIWDVLVVVTVTVIAANEILEVTFVVVEPGSSYNGMTGNDRDISEPCLTTHPIRSY